MRLRFRSGKYYVDGWDRWSAEYMMKRWDCSGEKGQLSLEYITLQFNTTQ